MTEEEKQYAKELSEAGVDVSDIPTETKEPEPETKPVVPEPTETVETESTETTDSQENRPEVQTRRSIYDQYKEKKSEVKTERELRQRAEQERDELKQRLEAVSNAQTSQERTDAHQDLEAFAEKIGADPETLREMREMFLKDVQPQTDPAIAKQLREFAEWQAQHAQILEKSRFEEEFKSVVPSIKELFPTSSEQEIEAIKEKIDELSHTEDFHDKELDYVIFKNKTELSKLVSPKKRGLESKNRQDVREESFDFDINADYSKMTPKERDAWESHYKKMTSEGTGIQTDGQGKKLFI